MFEQNSIKEKAWNRGIAESLQKGGTIKQAKEVFEVTPKIETIENNRNESWG
jgi:hypothetical protein